MKATSHIYQYQQANAGAEPCSFGEHFRAQPASPAGAGKCKSVLWQERGGGEGVAAAEEELRLRNAAYARGKAEAAARAALRSEEGEVGGEDGPSGALMEPEDDESEVRERARAHVHACVREGDGQGGAGDGR